jgi:putative membrane protein insertion efficiency factor
MKTILRTLIKAAIRGYQVVISPLLHWIGGPGSGCRFEPTCSWYCLEAVEQHGARQGLNLGVRRLVRCHPWGGAGLDPVPRAEAPSRNVGSETR